MVWNSYGEKGAYVKKKNLIECDNQLLIGILNEVKSFTTRTNDYLNSAQNSLSCIKSDSAYSAVHVLSIYP